MTVPDSTDDGVVSPRTAGRAAPEDRGQRYAEDMSASEMSDTYPAGRSRTPPHTVGVGAYPPEAKQTRRVSVDVRYTVAERAAIRRRARALGVKPSRWVRTAVLDALDARRHGVADLETSVATAPPPQPELAAAVEQLRRVGVNLNQVLRKDQTVDADLLREVANAVDGVRAQLGDRTMV